VPIANWDFGKEYIVTSYHKSSGVTGFHLVPHFGTCGAIDTLSQHMGFDPKDDMNATPLFWAAKKGQTAMVDSLLATGQVDVNAKTYDGYAPLSTAAVHGHSTVVEALLATGQADINGKKFGNRTPLRCAITHGDVKVVKLLLGTGQVDVETRDQRKRTPLWLAAMCGHAEVVKVFLATGSIDVEAGERLGGQTALSVAARCGHCGCS
jgi:ankyrin repeat protein